MAAQDPAAAAAGYSQLTPEQMMIMQQHMGTLPEHHQQILVQQV